MLAVHFADSITGPAASWSDHARTMTNRTPQRGESRVNLLITIDKRYVGPLLTMLDSYGMQHQDVVTCLFVAHSSLETQEIERIYEKASQYGIQLQPIHITEHWFKDTPVLERLPEESFYRLMAFHYLPAEIHRCLYLDPDIIIRKSLLPLCGMDLEGNYIAAASHMVGRKNRLNLRRLGIREDIRYLNSGVMLMDLDAIRRDFTIEGILSSTSENIQKLLLGDQDMVNILFGKRTKLIDERIYNLDERAFHMHQHTFDLQAVERETAIIHYNGKFKPWLNGYEGVLDQFYPQVEEKGPAPTGKWKAQMKAIHDIVRLTTQQKIALGCVLCFAAICLLGWMFFGRELTIILEEPELFRAWLNQFGVYDEVVFILVRAAQTVIKFIPAEPLEIAAGYAWGAVPGMLYCVIGNMLGTLVILWLTKRYGRRFVEAFIPKKNMQTFANLRMSDRLYALLFLLYLIPGAPKDGFTYFVGLLPVKVLPFMLISFTARMPSALSSTICGVALAEQRYMLSALILGLTLLGAIVGGLLYKAYYNRRFRFREKTVHE